MMQETLCVSLGLWQLGVDEPGQEYGQVVVVPTGAFELAPHGVNNHGLPTRKS